jgi:hypothetical protein
MIDLGKRRSFPFLAFGVLSVALAACGGQSGSPPEPTVPTTAPTAAPSGAVPTPTPKHTATPAPTATPTLKPTPTPTPTPATVSGAQAAAVLTIGSTTYGFVPGTIAAPAADAGAVGLAEVQISTGTTILSRHRTTLAHARVAPNTQGQRPRAAARFTRVHTLDTAAGGSPILTLSPAPQECAADVAHTDIYCISYASPIVNVVHVDASTAAMSLVATYTTDAAGLIGFSGGTATILGEAWDQTDNRLIIATASGYELYGGARSATPNAKIRQIATVNPSENFGYNSATNTIWSPSYLTTLHGMLINVSTGTQYALTPLPTGYVEPDHGAIDSSTNLAVASEEFTYDLHLIPLSQNVLNSPAAGQFSNPNATTISMLTSQANGCCPDSDISIDSATHLLFSAVEFGSGVGVVALPTTGAGTPALRDYVFAALPPNGSSGVPSLPGDPHATATFNVGAAGPYGLSFNDAYDTLIVVDMRAALAAPRLAGDPHGTTLTAGLNTFYITI